MFFNSLEFLVFFPLVTLVYFLLPHKTRWSWLLFASIVFYMSFIPIYILILALTITVDYFAGMWIEDTKVHKMKRFYLIFSIVTTLAILFVFKYFNFFNANIVDLARLIHWNYSVEALALILPIGLSFHTFQSMSYVIEVYRGKQKAERHFGIYSLYVMFYPQLVAGPIERPQNLIHQFYEEHKVEYKRIVDGLLLMLWGFFKKLVIADRLAIAVNAVYSSPHDFTGLTLIIATVFFAIQIFCDFSGYSDIAIGAAHVMGFKLMKNFDRPYHSRSISEFWKRWHISLSSWFKDYVYIPLGGNRVAIPRWYANLFIVFLLSGMWHGANWTFVIWGALHGSYLVASLIFQKPRNKVYQLLYLDRFPKLLAAVQITGTFILVCVGWIFFRANTVSDAWYILTHLFVGLSLDITKINIGLSKDTFILCILLMIFLELIHIIQYKGSIRHAVAKQPTTIRWTLYIALILIILLLGVFAETNFIYFQF